MLRLLGRLPIFLMTSFARSGETMLLRSLNAHREIIVLNQIQEQDHEEDARIFREIMTRKSTSFAPPQGFLRRKGKGRLLLVKHGIWVHRWPHRGFVFARNPFAVTASLLRYSTDRAESDKRARARLSRWAEKIDPELLDICQSGDLVEAISRLYLAKMTAAIASGLPIFRYEEFVTEPRAELERICAALGAGWDESVMTSEGAYAPGERGHGGIDLSAPIRPASFYAGGLTDEQIDKVHEITHEILPTLGYLNQIRSAATGL